MFADPLQDVDQVGVGVHDVHPAGDQQALDDSYPPGADLGGGEQPVSFAHRYGPKSSFEVVSPPLTSVAVIFGNPGGFWLNLSSN